MTTAYVIADLMIGVRNMIEAADLRVGDQVLLLADTRSDKPTVEALNAGLRFFGAEPMILVTEPIPRYGDVPQAVLEGMRASASSSGCGRSLSPLPLRIAPWDESARRAAANSMKAA